MIRAQDSKKGDGASAVPSAPPDPSPEPVTTLAPLPWLLWSIALLVIASGTRNPLLLGLALAVLWPVGESLASPPSLRLSGSLIALTTVWNFITVRAGESVLFRLPDGWPLIAGAYTFEAALYGALNGLALAVILNGFRMLTARLSPREVVRLVPPALYETGLALSIALAFLPQGRETLDEIRQAQAVRGHRVRGLRDLLPLLLPLLVTALERALALAEAMEARGFTARREPPSAAARLRLTAGLALLMLGVGTLLFSIPRWIGPLCLLGGLIVAGSGLRSAAAPHAPRPRTPSRPLTAADRIAGLAALAALLSWILLATFQPAALDYPIYPRPTWPELPWVAGLPILLLVLPAVADRRIPLSPRPTSVGTHIPADSAAAPPAIIFENVTFHYPEAARPTLRDIELTIPPGAFVLIAGPSGSGKSTLLRTINGLVPHSSGGRIAGHVWVGARDALIEGPAALASQVGFVIQNPVAGFVADIVEEEVAFALEIAGFPPEEVAARVAEALARTHLTPLRNRRLEHLSGGEQQRVALAAALALRPPILLLDEPLSQLDPEAAEEIVASLQSLHAQGLTLVVAEHRLERLLAAATRVVYLPGTGELWSASPAEAAARLPAPPPIVQLGRALNWDPLPLSVEQARDCPPPAPANRQAIEKRADERRKDPLPEPLLEIEALDVTLGTHPVLKDLTLSVGRGELVALLGHNGAGKTTLLRALTGLIPVRAGRIRLSGMDLDLWDVAARCRHLGYLPQEPDFLLFSETVAEELAVTLRNHRLPETQRIPPLLRRLGLEGLAAVYPRDLSVGERQRVALGAVTITHPALLLLDEPTRGLDMPRKIALGELLREWNAEGWGILLVTHDTEWVAQFADRVVVLESGRIVAAGDPHRVLKKDPRFAPQIARLFPEQGVLTVAEVLAR